MSLTQWKLRILVRICWTKILFFLLICHIFVFFFVQFQWLMNMFQCVIVIVEVISKCLTALRKHYSATLRPPRVFSPSNGIYTSYCRAKMAPAQQCGQSMTEFYRNFGTCSFFGRNYFCCCCCPRFSPPWYGCLSGSGVNKFVMKLIN